MKHLLLVTPLLLIPLTGCPNVTGAHKTVAEGEAKAFANELGLPMKTVTCRTKDTDGDGYVSCTFMLEDGSTDDYECAGARSTGNLIRNSGCRKAKGVLVK